MMGEATQFILLPPLMDETASSKGCGKNQNKVMELWYGYRSGVLQVYVEECPKLKFWWYKTKYMLLTEDGFLSFEELPFVMCMSYKKSSIFFKKHFDKIDQY